MNTDDPDDPDDRFLQALQGGARAWRLALERHLKANGLTMAGWNALTAVAACPEPPSQRELARRLGVDGATLVTTLDRLVASGLVRRDSEPGDRRVRRIALTPEGQAAADRVHAAAAALRRATVARLDAAAMAAAAAVLEELRSLLESA
jgi:MarR family transcriptional regulator for hemolysin